VCAGTPCQWCSGSGCCFGRLGRCFWGQTCGTVFGLSAGWKYVGAWCSGCFVTHVPVYCLKTNSTFISSHLQ
jgi:hypothetical protein